MLRLYQRCFLPFFRRRKAGGHGGTRTITAVKIAMITTPTARTGEFEEMLAEAPPAAAMAN
ncbi:MAG TPA: hypothetical protein VJT49_04020 [Amycolatopsis sp.]|uniref:hypothetical protein n=1 Tax=Amycolatopsis sp. TaxID=37632 RepID=UPI002B4A0A96|nr:hypothetical protein [Amycolatopsis sp.]HKS44278.1 hypothetical protein [Amycolatopsis sp.]